MNIKAVIFDLDGTIVSDEDEYGEAFRRVLTSLGVKINSKYPHVGGIGVEANWPILIKKYSIKSDRSIAELTGEIQKQYLKLLDRVTLKKGFLILIKRLREMDIKTAIATSNSRFILEEIFDRFGIEKYFDSVTTGEEVREKKPSPEIYKIAGDKLEIDPKYILVIEDSKAGIEAARRAGMHTAAIARGGVHKKELKEAEFVVMSLIDILDEVF